MDTLTLPTVPAHAIEARQTFQFTVTPAVLMEAQRASPFRGPEASLRKLGHMMADTKREAFRVSAHEDLPDSWVRTEVTLYQENGIATGDVQVEVALLVEPPEPLGVWVQEHEQAPGAEAIRERTPRLASTAPPAPLRHYGYCTVDGRPVYGPRP